MNRLKVDKNSPLYEIIDVVIEPGFYRDQSNYKEDTTITIKELVEAYYELRNLESLKMSLLTMADFIKENIKR